jgi:hypothetical protein
MSRPKMPQMIFARRNHVPPDSWWVACDRETFAQRMAARLPHMQPAQASDLTYGPHRGGSGYGSLPAVKGAYSA